MHDAIPWLSSGCSPQGHKRKIKRSEVDILINEVTFWYTGKETHSCNTESKQDQEKKQGSIQDVLNRHEQCLQQGTKTLGGLDHPEQSGDSDDTQWGYIEIELFLKEALIDGYQGQDNHNKIELVPVYIPVILKSIGCQLQHHLNREEDNKEEVRVG